MTVAVKWTGEEKKIRFSPLTLPWKNSRILVGVNVAKNYLVVSLVHPALKVIELNRHTNHVDCKHVWTDDLRKCFAFQRVRGCTKRTFKRSLVWGGG